MRRDLPVNLVSPCGVPTLEAQIALKDLAFITRIAVLCQQAFRPRMARNCAFFSCGDKIPLDWVTIQNFSLSQGQSGALGPVELGPYRFWRAQTGVGWKWTILKSIYGEVARRVRISPGAAAF